MVSISARELAPALIDQGQAFGLTLGDHLALAHDLGKPEDRVQRALQVVADAGEEQAAHARRGFARVDRAHLCLGKDAKALGELLDRLQEGGHDPKARGPHDAGAAQHHVGAEQPNAARCQAQIFAQRAAEQ